MKKLMSLLLGTALVLALAACSNSGGVAVSPTPGIPETGAPAWPSAPTEEPSYTIAHNMLSASLYPFQVVAQESERALGFYGCSLVTADNEFSSDKVISDIQSQCASGVDGYEFICTYSALFEQACNELTNAGVPFILYDKVPSLDDTAVWDVYYGSPLFLGAVTANEYEAGSQMGRKAAGDGAKTAVIARSGVGDYSHDERHRGFEDAFTAAGGEIVDVTYCDPPEATTKINDLLTANPNVDCIYAAGGDWAEASFSATESRNDWTKDLKVYTTDLSPSLAGRVLDGSLSGLNGGQFALAAITDTLIINYLDGHQVLDPDGKVPVLIDVLPYLEVTPGNAQAYIDLVEAGEWIISEAQYKQCLYRYNPGASYQDLVDLVERYAECWDALGG